MIDLAEQLTSLNLAAWQQDRGDPILSSQLQADHTAAGRAHLQGTPTVILSGPAGTKELVGGLPDYAGFERAIRRVR